MSSVDAGTKTGMACFTCCWDLFIRLPLFLWLIYRLLVSANASESTWTIFWAYVLSAVVGIVLSAFLKALLEAK